MKSQNYISLQIIGQGSFAVVQRVRSLVDGQQYAIKRVKYAQLKQKNKKNAVNQIHILSLVQHPNVIAFKQSFFDQATQNLCTVMELAPGGDLAHRIKSKAECSQFFTEQEIWNIGKDIVNGISALHQRNIIHRDIKPANILFGLKDVAKIGDLNVSIELKNHFVYTQTGTPFYASPQVWSHEPYSFQCDVWSLGCVLYQMCMLKKPFQSHSVSRLHRKINKLKYEPMSCKFSNKLQNLIQRCLQFKAQRVSLYQLKKIFNEHQLYQNEYEHQSKIGFSKSIFSNYDDTKLMYPYSQIKSHSQNQASASLQNKKYGISKKSDQPTTVSSIENKFGSVLDKYLVSERKLPSSNRDVSKYQNEQKQNYERQEYQHCDYLYRRSDRITTQNNICTETLPNERIAWKSRYLAEQEPNMYRWDSRYRNNYLLY